LRNVYIYLNNGILVKDFIEVLNGLSGEFEVQSDLTTLDARSILGLYCQDLSDPVLLRVEDDSPGNMEKLRPFIISRSGSDI